MAREQTQDAIRELEREEQRLLEMKKNTVQRHQMALNKLSEKSKMLAKGMMPRQQKHAK